MPILRPMPHWPDTAKGCETTRSRRLWTTPGGSRPAARRRDGCAHWGASSYRGANCANPYGGGIPGFCHVSSQRSQLLARRSSEALLQQSNAHASTRSEVSPVHAAGPRGNPQLTGRQLCALAGGNSRVMPTQAQDGRSAQSTQEPAAPSRNPQLTGRQLLCTCRRYRSLPRTDKHEDAVSLGTCAVLLDQQLGARGHGPRAPRRSVPEHASHSCLSHVYSCLSTSSPCA